MKIRWLNRALHSLEDIADYIASDNPKAAERVINDIMKSVAGLAKNPKLGRIGRVTGTRELIIGDTPYIVPYRIKHNEIHILHVFHSARRWPEEF